MTANPLLSRVSSVGGRATAAQLIDYAEWLNRQGFVRANGWEYFVSGVTEDQAKLDRRGG